MLQFHALYFPLLAASTPNLMCLCCSFMKLRLDRVLKLELGEHTPEVALKSLKPVPDFKPLNQTVHWTAPYPPYKPGWWQQFEPKH